MRLLPLREALPGRHRQLQSADELELEPGTLELEPGLWNLSRDFGIRAGTLELERGLWNPGSAHYSDLAAEPLLQPEGLHYVRL